ncbi:MAG: GNAT family N-acetyltransferase [Cyanobium sp. CZS 48M]|nr:GNAT family N-acetyltransferase [Cyanobium sp. CZS48M]
MRPQAFSSFIEQAIESSLDDLEGLNRWTKTESLKLAQSEIERLLPDGLSTPNNILLEILENENEPAIGYIWLSLGSRGSEKIAFVHQLIILPQHRRQGHAQATLKAVEAVLLARGVGVIVLHVFNSNTTAQQLYATAGYEVASLNLQKKLTEAEN